MPAPKEKKWAELKGWKELAEISPGAIVPGVPTSPEYLTGDWRTERPIWDPDKCTHCLLCWVYCPEDAIMLNISEDGKVVKMIGIDYDYCKGCGICVRACPPKIHALDMAPEEV